MALGALLAHRAGAARLGAVGGAAGVIAGATVGCAAAFAVCQILAPAVALLLSWCCRGSQVCARLGFLAVGAVPAIWLTEELLRLC